MSKKIKIDPEMDQKIAPAKETPPEPTSDPALDHDIAAQVDEKLKEAALKGAETILNMITDPEASDASRLAAAKWAVERVSKDKSPDGESVSLSELMEVVRGMRSQAKPATTPPANPAADAAKPSEPENFDQWIDSNLNH